MRHRKANRKLNRTSSHRKALLANLTNALLQHEQITTTLAKAKTLRPTIEKIITKARVDTLQRRRNAIARIKDIKIVQKLFSKIAPRYKDRPGGYTRIIKAGYRKGDDSPMAVIELLDRDIEAKGLSDRIRNEEKQKEKQDE